jgi:small GTP-binding protein
MRRGKFLINKVVFLGASESGKTQLCHRIHHNKFSEMYLETLDVDFFSKTVNGAVHDVKKLHILDATGHPRFTSIVSSYLRETAFIICCIDCSAEDTVAASLEYLQDPVFRLEDLGDDVRIVLMLTKTDLNPTYDKAAILKQVIEAGVPISSNVESDVFATSAKDNVGIKEFIGYLERNFVDPAFCGEC